MIYDVNFFFLNKKQKTTENNHKYSQEKKELEGNILTFIEIT